MLVQKFSMDTEDNKLCDNLLNKQDNKYGLQNSSYLDDDEDDIFGTNVTSDISREKSSFRECIQSRDSGYGNSVSSPLPSPNQEINNNTEHISIDDLYHKAVSRRLSLADFIDDDSEEEEEEEVYNPPVVTARSTRYSRSGSQSNTVNKLSVIPEDESDIYIDENGISKTKKSNKVTIYPGQQKKSDISINWEIKKSKEPIVIYEFITPPPSTAPTETTLITGYEDSVGTQAPIEPRKKESVQDCVDVIFGGDSAMSSHPSDAPSSEPEVGKKKRRSSIKSVVSSLFSGKKKKSYSQSDIAMKGDSPNKSAPGPSTRGQRRHSRLEMNEPIEDVFAEVCNKFDKMKKSNSSSIEEEDVFCDDVIEDPDAVLMSLNNNRDSPLKSLCDSTDVSKLEKTKLLSNNFNKSNNRQKYVSDVDLT